MQHAGGEDDDAEVEGAPLLELLQVLLSRECGLKALTAPPLVQVEVQVQVHFLLPGVPPLALRFLV
jgi:hypothetical protein